ncbi:MAG TPA: NAD(P)-dependent oxidoreductase [Myxococcaceae bacterium]|nr:NAD(P)-dependent oxidoreductase [Myxococcaceae bacterium]
MKGARITITGGSGFVGQLLRTGLRERGYEVTVFDRYRGAVVDLLRSRTLPGRLAGRPAFISGPRVRRLQHELESRMLAGGLLRPSGDDISDARGVLAGRFRGSAAVIHLAGIPHPLQPGATEADFVRLNYDAAVNVFEAARDANVPVFVFASSAQVYKINDPVRLDHLPILESNHLPLPAEGQSVYGFLKAAVERYLAGACQTGSTQAISLRLECPGFLSPGASNQYISTSVENLVNGFTCALSPPADLGADVFNLADADVSPEIVDVAAYARARWPYVPFEVRGNGCLLSTEKAQRMLGYRPRPGGRYIPAEVVW